MNHDDDGIFFRRRRRPGRRLVGERAGRASAHLDGMNAERVFLIAAECIGDGLLSRRQYGYASETLVFGRPIGHEPGRPVPDRAGARADRGGKTDAYRTLACSSTAMPSRPRRETGEGPAAEAFVGPPPTRTA